MTRPSQVRAVANHRRKCVETVRYMKDKPCADCGNKFDLDAMEFDHPPGIKDVPGRSIMDMIYRRGLGIKKILAEVEKCDVVCAVCHRLRTKQRRLARVA